MVAQKKLSQKCAGNTSELHTVSDIIQKISKSILAGLLTMGRHKLGRQK